MSRSSVFAVSFLLGTTAVAVACASPDLSVESSDDALIHGGGSAGCTAAKPMTCVDGKRLVGCVSTTPAAPTGSVQTASLTPRWVDGPGGGGGGGGGGFGGGETFKEVHTDCDVGCVIGEHSCKLNVVTANAPACPRVGLYCGSTTDVDPKTGQQTQIIGDAKSLYHCDANHQLTLSRACKVKCLKNLPGVDDVCDDGTPAPAPTPTPTTTSTSKPPPPQPTVNPCCAKVPAVGNPPVKSNFCHVPPNTADCPMTAPGGYCDPNRDSSYTDGDWNRGYNEYQSQCK